MVNFDSSNSADVRGQLQLVTGREKIISRVVFPRGSKDEGGGMASTHSKNNICNKKTNIAIIRGVPNVKGR